MLEMTNVSPDGVTDELAGTIKHHWKMSIYEGAWVKGATAGGCRNYLRKFYHLSSFYVP